MNEDWKNKEIRDLKAQKEKLEDAEKRENIWTRALSSPEDGWKITPSLEEQIRERGLVVSHYSALKEMPEFKRRLLIGACKYLQDHPPLIDNKITSLDIYNVLASSKKFGHFISSRSVRQWVSGAVGGFADIVSDYKISTVRYSHLGAWDKFMSAVRGWYEEHPTGTPTHADIARILRRSEAAVSAYTLKNPEAEKLMKKRPRD